MNHQAYDQRLRSAYRARVGAAGAVPDALWESVVAIPDEIPVPAGTWSRRPTLLLAAALLAALLAGTVAAIGSGLLPLPWPDGSRVPREPSLSAVSSVMVHGASPCDLSLPAGVVMEFGDEYTLFADGLLIRSHEGDFPGGAHEQRQMSSSAVEELLTAIESSGLGGCRVYQSAGPEVGVLALTASGVVTFGAGGTDGTYYVASEQERLVASRIADRLAEPDLGIAVDDWIQIDWSPYASDVEVRSRRWIGPSKDERGTVREGWAEIVMPDGTPITSLGGCRVVSEAEAGDIAALLGPPVEESTNEWMLRDATGGIVVQLSRVGAGEEGCQLAVGPEDRTNVIDELDPCSFNPPGWSILSTWHDFGSGWAACESLSDGWTFVSRHPVTSDEAETIIHDIFGVGVETEVIGAATVYFNACHRLDPPDCVVAVAAEPYLLVIDPDGRGGDLRTLAEGVIEGLAR